MTNPDGGPSPSEIGRSVREALGRIEALAVRIDQNFVSNRVLDLHEQNNALRFQAQKSQHDALSRDVENKVDKAEFAELKARITSLEDDKKWMQRLVFGLIVTAVVGLVLAVPSNLLG